MKVFLNANEGALRRTRRTLIPETLNLKLRSAQCPLGGGLEFTNPFQALNPEPETLKLNRLPGHRCTSEPGGRGSNVCARRI